MVDYGRFAHGPCLNCQKEVIDDPTDTEYIYIVRDGEDGSYLCSEKCEAENRKK